MGSGERYCLLFDSSSGVPLFYPNLYVTTQVHNRSLSYSAMEYSLNGISIFLRFLSAHNENIEKRFHSGHFLQENELDALRDFCQIKYRTKTIIDTSDGLHILSELQELDQRVSTQTQYVRLTVIARYIKWLAEQVVGINKDPFTVLQNGKRPESKKTRQKET